MNECTLCAVSVLCIASMAVRLPWAAHTSHAVNLIAPGRAANMGEGWETARHKDRPAVRLFALPRRPEYPAVHRTTESPAVPHRTH
jgi:hypothetical protein